MNIGVDYLLSFYDATSGGLIEFGDIQDVKITAMKHDIKSSPYNQLPRFAYVPDGYKFDFTITRNGSLLEDLAVKFSQDFNNGKVQGSGYLNETITNPDGTVSRYQYKKFVMFLNSHGDISRDKVVTLTAEGMASEKIQIA
jgi:hypothetical protein